MICRWKQIRSILFCLALVVGLVPVMGLTVLAYEDNPYASLVNTTTPVTFNRRPWFIIEDKSTAANAGTLTLLAADTSFGTAQFTKKGKASNNYKNSRVKELLDAQTGPGGDFEAVKLALVDTEFGRLYLLSRDEAGKLPSAILKFDLFEGDATGEWWTRTPGKYSDDECIVYGGSTGAIGGTNGWNVKFKFGIRPALQLKLSNKVLFSSVTLSGGANTRVSGSTKQNYFDYRTERSAMKSVTYKAKDGYKFPDAGDFNYGTKNGITVERVAGTEVKVSGTPNGVVKVKVPDAVPLKNEGDDDDDPQVKKETLLLNAGFVLARKGTNVQVKWGAVPNADTYVVYAAYCGEKACRKVKTLHSGTEYTLKKLSGKKLNQKKHVKAFVVAYRRGVKLGRTILGHTAGSKTQYTDARNLKVAKSIYHLKVGKTATITASLVKADSKKRLLGSGHGEKYRFVSSDQTVATVDKYGKIKARKAGKCQIWVYAKNGRGKKVTVTVKK